VKELGPANVADGRGPDAGSVAAGGAALSPQKSDLALLRNANVSLILITDIFCLGLFEFS